MTLRTRSFALGLLVAGAAAGAFAQIPNAGFEAWTGGEPDRWLTNNFPGSPTITQSADAHTGSSAARGEVVEVFGFPLPPNLISSDSGGFGFPVSQAWAELRGWYKLSTPAVDEVLVSVIMTIGDSTVGVGGEAFGAAAAYTPFSVPIAYIPGAVPDSAYITITMVGDTLTGVPSIGATFLVDDLSFSGTVDAEEPGPGLPEVTALAQNYPNPFNPSTRISFVLAESGPVMLQVFDLLGRRVATLVDGDLPAGSHVRPFDAAGLAGGVYMYRLTTAGSTLTRKMSLLR